MEKKMPKFNIFHAKVDDILAENEFCSADFSTASAEEKESMVEMHKSVSYWKDAARRFRQNHVSMVALAVVLLITFFAFLGPRFIPYSYEEQYRGAMKLGPFEYSEGEQIARDILKDADRAFATSMQPGSITSLKKGTYTFKYGGEWYTFTLKKTLRSGLLVLDTSAAEPLYTVKEDDYLEAAETDAAYETTPVSYEVSGIQPAAEKAEEIKMISSVFPHVFGTDSAGRDIMSRCMYGARVSLLIGVIASLIVLVIGATYGAISGLLGGKADFIMMRIVELIYSVPDVLIVLLLQVVLQQPLQSWFDSSNVAFVKALSSLGVGIVSIFITFALLYWVGMSRIIRGQVLMLKKQEYVTAAIVLGASNKRIIKRHLLPNSIGQLVVTTCLQIPSAIFLESFLSFLGLGISAPMSSLGSMCSDAIDTITVYPYRLLFPAILLSLLVLSLNLVGDGLRDALDPRLKK
jgi:ABC-type dipeptide/oligopeptide/nickel transport system permease subunit